ncbi:MAG: hypothetical protein IPN26_02410 [Bacteroidetes bacterium]|nr:hypothetical protein [Bacteroidota bacterium]
MDLNNIQYKTSVPVEKPVVDVFEEYIVELKIPSYIPDGAKHKIFKAIIHQLVELNKDISEPDIYRFMYHVNSGRAVPPMDKRKLDTLIDFNIKEIRNNPDYSYSNYIKRCVHFNSNCSLPGQLKRAISSKLNGKMKNNESIEKIQLAKELMVKEGIKPTIKGIARITGLDRNTVRKNFNKPLNDLSKEVDKINEEYCIQGYYNTAISISGSINTHEQEVNKEFGKPRNIDLSTMDFYQNHTGSLGY